MTALTRTRRAVTPTPRLSDLTLADAGRSFAMRPGSVRFLLLPVGLEDPVVIGPVEVTPEEASGLFGQTSSQSSAQDESAPGQRRYRVKAMARGSAVLTVGQATWSIEVRGARHVPEQTLDDTDAGWGERGSGHPRTWWEEQRPPHW